jgi:hypothetical protein
VRNRCLIAALLGITTLTATASASEDPAAVANGFYGVYATFHPSDGIPDAKTRAKLEPFISPALDKLLINGEAAEAHFAQVTKNMSPPLIEGDLFTSNFEGATTFHIGACTISGEMAHCSVSFSYRGGDKRDSKPVDWTDTVHLLHMANGWRVDDIAYGATWAFGNKGRLKDVLASAIRDGNSATP